MQLRASLIWVSVKPRKIEFDFSPATSTLRVSSDMLDAADDGFQIEGFGRGVIQGCGEVLLFCGDVVFFMPARGRRGRGLRDEQGHRSACTAPPAAGCSAPENATSTLFPAPWHVAYRNYMK